MLKDSRIATILCLIIVALVGFILFLFNCGLRPTIPESFSCKVVIDENTGKTAIYTDIKAISTDKDGNLIIKGGEGDE